MKIATIIPVWTETLDEMTLYFLRHNISLLNDDSEIYLMIPELLDISFYEQNLNDVTSFNIHYKRFEDKWFKSSQTYNELCFSNLIWTEFENFDYVLICHLDAYIFKPELKFWCEKGYDYIGAPWFNQEWLEWKPFVGNGGLSLRNPKIMKIIVDSDVITKNGLDKFNEDFCFSFIVSKIGKVPNHVEAAKFAWEASLDICKEITKNKLPFGIHGIKG